MGFIEKWKAREQTKEIKHEKRLEENKIREEAQKREILSALKRYGIDESSVDTNGYWYHFTGRFRFRKASGEYTDQYNHLFVDFVNQDTRLCGKMHRPTVNEDEAKCVRDAPMLLHGPDYSKEDKEQFQREFNYRSFIFNGPTSRTIQAVLCLAEMPLESVIMLQDKEHYSVDDHRLMGKTKIGTSPFGDVYRLDDGTVTIM